MKDIAQIPGVNVPTSHLGYYVFALLVAGILHEFGHAFAAVRYSRNKYHVSTNSFQLNSEKCKINSFGMFIVGVYPGAFVDIGEGMEKLSPLSLLKMYIPCFFPVSSCNGSLCTHVVIIVIVEDHGTMPYLHWEAVL